MDIVFVSSEMVPFSKTGGLADVAGALPKALAAAGHRVLAVSPRYRPVDGTERLRHDATFHLFGRDHRVSYHRLERDGVTWVLVDNPCFHRPGIYGDQHGSYGDNLFRYALFSRAALDIGGLLGEEVVFHANDWHTGLLPVYMNALYRQTGRFHRAAVVLGLHNLGHQGSTDASQFAGLDLPSRWWPVLDMGGRLNPLKAGMVTADALVAVSPTYAKQIQHDQGFGLESILRTRSDRLVGVLNGIGDDWDPATDVHLADRFDADDLSGKAQCKAWLQQRLGLPVRPDVPLLGLVARLDHQKGIDLVEDIAPWLLRQDVQLVMLGSGAARFEAFFREAERRWPDRARGWVGFSEPLAHQIEAAADIYLMPSRFEPCGLNQMYALRYGAIPVVHATGGLVDTVFSYDPRTGLGNGWAFHDMSAEGLARALRFALLTYRHHPQTWRLIQQRGMRTDLTWRRSADVYTEIYRKVLAWNAAA